MCSPAGQRIDDGEVLLLRAVIPRWNDPKTGLPSSQAFEPMDGHENCLSVHNGTLVSPEESFQLANAPRPKGFELGADAVWGISVGEVDAIELEIEVDGKKKEPKKKVRLYAASDPAEANSLRNEPANPAHCVIEFGAIPGKALTRAARKLKDAALARGCLRRA